MHKLHSIQNKIIWPLLFIIAVGAAGMAYFIYSQASDSIHQKGLTTSEVVRIGIENALIARKTAEEVMEQEMTGQAVLVSYIANQGIGYEQISEISKRAGIDEIWISDNKGKVTLTSAGSNIDFDFGAGPGGQAYEFMGLITGKRSVVAQPAQKRSLDPKVYKYVGVSGWSGPKIVQVGREGKRLTELENEIGAKPMIEQLKRQLGKDVLFAGIVDQSGKLIYASDEKVAALQPELLDSLKTSIQTKATVRYSLSYGGNKADYYVSSLSDNRGLVIALSTKVLDDIRTTTFVATAVVVLLAAALLFFIVHRQMKRLRLLQNAMTSISEGDGDLTQRLPQTAKDEIGLLSVASNQFIDRIHSIVNDVKSATMTSKTSVNEVEKHSRHTTELSKEISATIHQVAASTATQAEKVEDGMKAIQELADLVDRSKQQTGDLYRAKQTIEERQEKGTVAVNALKVLMDRNTTVSRTAEHHLERLKSDIDAIHRMTDMIAAISKQTGLLALNASIEAARAGEQGRGFSVVATEVRKLSEQSNDSTEQIRALIENVQLSAASTVESMGAVTDIVREQGAAVRLTSTAFSDIKEILSEISDRVSQISAAMDVLGAKKQAIVAFIESASAVAEQTAASSEEIVATVESQLLVFDNVNRLTSQLQHTMGQLQQAVDRFKI